MEQITLREVLLGIVSGSFTYPIAQWVFREMDAFGLKLTRLQKRAASYVVSFAISFAALLLASYLGYMDLTVDSAFSAFVSAFAASQALHGWFDLRQ